MAIEISIQFNADAHYTWLLLVKLNTIFSGYSFITNITTTSGNNENAMTFKILSTIYIEMVCKIMIF